MASFRGEIDAASNCQLAWDVSSIVETLSGRWNGETRPMIWGLPATGSGPFPRSWRSDQQGPRTEGCHVQTGSPSNGRQPFARHAGLPRPIIGYNVKHHRI